MMTSSAMRFDRFGSIDYLAVEPIPDPPLAEGQIRVAVRVAGLNPVDWQIVESPELAAVFGISTPAGFGNDFAGVVSEVGARVTEWAPGDRVYGGARGSAVATSLVLDADHPSLHRTPEHVTDLTAGVLDIAGRTASAVADRLAARPGDVVLVGAAGGGVGSILTQLLMRTGAHVIGTGSEGSFAHIRSLGAHPVPYGPGLEDAVRATTPNQVAAAADLYGSATAEAAPGLGVSASRIVTIEAENPPAGVHAVNGSDARPDALHELTQLIANGHLRVPIAARYRLAQFAEAVAFQRSRHARGKVAIEISGP